MSRPDQVAASVTAMLRYQSAYGSFVASPDSGQYQFCWRGTARSSAAPWTPRASRPRRPATTGGWRARWAPCPRHGGSRGAGRPPGTSRLLPPARFALDGSTVADDWPNFQIDGYGAWIWSLREHLRLGGDRGLLDEIRAVVDATWRYLDVMALHSCFDVWEEHGDRVHTSTLACVHAGLSAAADLLGEPRAAARAAEVESFLLDLAARYGRFPKSGLGRRGRRERAVAVRAARDRGPGRARDGGHGGRDQGRARPGRRDPPLSRRHVLRRRGLARADRLAGPVLAGRGGRPGRRTVPGLDRGEVRRRGPARRAVRGRARQPGHVPRMGAPVGSPGP